MGKRAHGSGDDCSVPTQATELFCKTTATRCALTDAAELARLPSPALPLCPVNQPPTPIPACCGRALPALCPAPLPAPSPVMPQMW